MIVGLLIAVLITYRKKRIAKPVIQQQTQDVSMADSIVETKEVTFNVTHFFTIVAIIAALVLQIITDSLILGALVGIIVMFVTRVVKDRKSTRLNSSHVAISYAVVCLQQKRYH